MTTLTEQRAKKAIHITRVGVVWNVFLTLIKFAAAVWGHSSALLADAIHSFTDFISDIVILAGLKIASRPKDHNHHYGHGKFETLATLVLTLFLFGAAFGMLWEGGLGLYRSWRGIPVTVPASLTLWVAAASIVVKEALFHYTARAGNKLNSKALITNAWHHRSDAITSIAVFIGLSGAIFLGPKWRVLDPLLAVGISGYIIHFASVTFKTAIDELLDASLDDTTNRD
jgi:cation diffusion facilitator family transporter